MKKALIISVLLHLSLFFCLLFDFEKPQQKTSSTLRIDFVSIGPKTAAPKITKKPAAAPESQNNDSKKIEISKIKKIIEKPEKKPEPKPKEDPKPPVLEKKKDKKVESDPKKNKKEKKITPDTVKKKEVIQKKESEKKKKPQEKQKDTKTEKLKKEKLKTEDKPKKEIKKKTLSKAHVDLDEQIKSSKKIDQMMDALTEGEEGVDADAVSTQVTASEVDAIIQTLYKCWHVPGGIRGASNMTVPVEIWVDKEGNITRHKVCMSPTSPEMAAAIKSAERAVSDPRCQPLPIPKNKYDQFKNMIIDFNPKNMF